MSGKKWFIVSQQAVKSVDTLRPPIDFLGQPEPVGFLMGIPVYVDKSMTGKRAFLLNQAPGSLTPTVTKILL